MSTFERKWSPDAFDAISLMAFNGEFEIEGTDGDQVELKGEFDGRLGRELKLEPQERWLQLQLWERPSEGQITLRLPKKKAWVVDVYAGRGEVEVSGLQARLRAMLGKGEIKVSDCRGRFNLASGRGDVEIKRCAEAEMPERPPVPKTEARFEMPPVPERPVMEGTFNFHMGRGPHRSHRMKGEGPWDWWWDFGGEDWAEWGAQFGEQARVWAQQFASQFLGSNDWLPEKGGLNVRLGKGDAQLERIEAKSCIVRLANGDVKLEEGRIENLDVDVAHGGVTCEGVLPVEEWEIATRHGDIQLELPNDTRARLDVATRHGDIDSDVPLVRVGRPGPEARHGGRMVGTVGQAGGSAAQISLTAQSGDIRIEWQHAASAYAGRQTSGDVPVEVDVPVPVNVPVSPPTAEAPTTEPVAAATATPDAEDVKEKSTAAAGSGYSSQLEILEALRTGQISIEEADALLRSLER
jgi:Toastrack DUF4097